jgi:hypothetical protein
MDVHARDVVAQLAKEGIEGEPGHFSWLSQLRLYWEVSLIARVEVKACSKNRLVGVCFKDLTGHSFHGCLMSLIQLHCL